MIKSLKLLLAVAIVATAVFTAFKMATSGDVAAEPTPPAPESPQVLQNNPEPPNPTAAPEPPTPAPPVVASSQPTGPEAPAPPTGAPAEKKDNPLANMMENPVMRDMMRQQMTAQFKSLYAGFFEKYGVDETLAQPVYDLLIARQMAAVDEVGTLFDKEATKEAKQAARKKVADSMDSYNEQIEDLLGEEAYQEFDLYEKSAGERMELTSLKGAMDSAGHDFPVEKEEKLMAIMYEERQNFDFTNNFIDQTKAYEQEFSKENFSRFTEEYVTLQENINTRVSEVLSADEHAVFTENQENYRNMIKAGIEMQSNMFGGGE
ncbi:MAG: hypothetical protein P8J87_04745 [Verrucomicrobiales bacterium]|nr:hypothetical protein [Verrucomicrobiales bacterium]